MVEVSKMKSSKQSNIQINAYRLYLQVVTLSDISNPDRRTINSHSLEGNKPLFSRSTFRRHNQPLPSPKAWNLQRRIVRKVFNINNNNSLPIHQHLTQWIVPYSSRQIQHRWNFSIEKEVIYEIHNNKIHRHFTVKNKVLTFTLNLDSKKSCSTLPQDFIPISFMRRKYVFLHK